MWIATDFGIQSLQDVGVREHLTKRDHVLVLRPDGSCSFKSFLRPDRVFEGGDPEYRIYDAGCTWSLGKVDHQSLNLSLPSSSAVNTYYYLDDESGKLLLWQYVADPDQWKYIEFEKAQPNSG